MASRNLFLQTCFPLANEGPPALRLSILSLLVLLPLSAQRLYKAAGDEARHQYTMTLGLPEFVRAKANAANLSDVSLSCC